MENITTDPLSVRFDSITHSCHTRSCFIWKTCNVWNKLLRSVDTSSPLLGRTAGCVFFSYIWTICTMQLADKNVNVVVRLFTGDKALFVCGVETYG